MFTVMVDGILKRIVAASPRKLLLASTALGCALAVPEVAQAQTLPSGGSVAAGSVAITQPSATRLSITQSSQNAVVNWQGFSIASGSAVNFAQPNSSSAILNRVTGSTPSTIAGSLTANGQVYLVNPNGVAITKSGSVDVGGGFVASTLGISDDDFMSGKRGFTGNGASAAVSNAGSISVGRGGYAALIGGTVANSGSINVPLGKVGLGSGEQATLDFAGDGFLQVAMPTAAGGRGALIRNSGSIKADGGSVVISAATAREAARNAVNISGLVQARSIGGHNGAITIGGGAGGKVRITGRLIATSRHYAGGSITVTGQHIKLKGATVDASGATGGGNINIGGGQQGAGPLQHADTTTIDASTTIKADAAQSGNGGNVVVWSDLLTTFAGTISARGGALGGNGGEAEVSGKARLDYTGFTNLTATNGAFGTLLLDPENVTISDAANANQSGFTATGDDSVINVTTLQNALLGANVTVSTGTNGAQAGDITVAAAVTWSSGSKLTLSASHSIAVNANINVNGGGSLVLNYGGPGGTLSFAQGASANFAAGNSGQTLTINGQAYTLLYSMADVDGIDGVAASGNAINSQAGGLSGNYALASNLVATGTTYSDAPVGTGPSSAFTGTFEGLGHTITGLTVSKSGSDAGLFGVVGSGGTVRDIGLIGGAVSITGGFSAGGLVGLNAGTITQAFTTGTVSGGSAVGGLVGDNTGTITQAYATGAVKGVGLLGGLVGENDGTIAQAYATGAVSGQTGIGGLVGENDGTIAQAYATGAVSVLTSLQQTTVGGLVGDNASTGTITQAYYDLGTTGQANGIGADDNSQRGNVSGLTTRQLQGLDPISGASHFSTASNLGDGTSSAFSGGANGLYPYLTNFFPNGVQAISGTAYNNAGGTPLASTIAGAVSVSVIGNGNVFGSPTTGANGYYYAFAAAGSIASGQNVLAFTNANGTTGATNAATLASSAGAGAQSGINIYGNTLSSTTTATLLSQAPSASAVLAAATTAAGGNAGALAAIGGATGRGLISTGTSFTIDQSLTISNGIFVAQTLGGAPLTIASPITVDAGGSLGLLSDGMLAINAAVNVNGAGSVALAYDPTTPINSVNLIYNDAGGNPISSSAGGLFYLNGQAYTLLYSMADIDGIDGVAASGNAINSQAGGLSGHYALASNLVATGTTYSDALVGTSSASAFTGTFEGLGHTITGLTVSKSGSDAGLFGVVGSGGTVRDIGLIGGAVSITGGFSAGGLVGLNAGTITQAFTTGTVSGGSAVGGLVGDNTGTITQAYATGAVKGVGLLGGLVGLNDGTIAQAYATGAVSGQTGIGGLVGENEGTIVQAYATGAVSVLNSLQQITLGGLVGNNASTGTITNGYYDLGTTGQANGIGDDENSQRGNVSGLTTRQLQGLDPISGSIHFSTVSNLGDGTSSAFSGGANGLYPYLTYFFPNGVQAISGVAYKDAGATPLASTIAGAASVSAVADGAGLGSATTGANGYYYILVPAGTIAANAGVVAYTTANGTTGATNAATLASSAGAGAQSGIDIYGNTLSTVTTATLLSQAPSASAVLAAATTAAGGDAGALAAINGTTGRGLIATGSFTIDQSLTISNGIFVAQTLAGAPLTVASPITVDGGGSLGLLSSGTLAINAAVNVNGAGSVALAYDPTLPISGANLFYNDAGGNPISSSAGGLLYLNSQAYTLLYSMADIDGIDGVAASGNAINTQAGGLSGSYALAGNLVATGTTYSDALVGTSSASAFTGTFEGLGHTITGLTVSKSGSDAGLFGVVGSGGTVRDIGLIGGAVSITGGFSAGGLVGVNAGTITQAFTTGTVSGGSAVGGLVGDNTGTITQAYATGAVKGVGLLGGLVGLNDGTIAQAYATGAVSGQTGIGGLVGENEGTIAQAYATGAVSVLTSLQQITLGGLVGNNASTGTITNGYYDLGTTGQANGIGDDENSQRGNVSGLTTRQLQGLDPISGSIHFSTVSNLGNGTSSAFSGGAGGLYPYLTSFFPNGVQAISGVAYKDAGATPLASTIAGAASVSAVADGAGLGSATTGANGYYYILVPAGTIAANAGVVAYTTADVTTGAQNGASFTQSTGAANTNMNLDVFGGWRRDLPGSTLASLSSLQTAFATAVGGTAPANFTLANREIDITAPAFSIDQALTATGTLVLSGTGAVSQTAAGTITTPNLLLSGPGASYALTGSGNHVGALAANTGAVALADADSLAIGAVNGVSGVTTTGAVSLATAGDLTIAAGSFVSGASPSLAANGAFVNQAGGNAVTATSGRWLVYSADPAGDTFGSLDSGNTAVWNTAAGASVSLTGDRYAFAAQPTLTVTTTSDRKTYGDDVTAQVANDYTITGFDPGVTGVYLADTAATALTGTPNVTSTGSGAAAAVAGSPYAITASAGSVVAASGYAISFANLGSLAVAPKTLTITASDQNKTYGDTANLGGTAFSQSGLVTANGDSISGVTLASLGAAASAEVAGSPYAITASNAIGNGLSNYSISYVSGGLTVAARTLIITASDQSKTYGDTANLGNTAFSQSGLVTANGDSISGVTLASLGAMASAEVAGSPYAITASNAIGTRLSNYSISYVSGGLTVTPRALTITASDQSKTYGDTANLGSTAFSQSGLVTANGDSISSVTLASLGAAASAGVAGSPYAITGSNAIGTRLSNYSISYVSGGLTVAPRALVVTADAQSRVYGDANPAQGGASGNNLVNGDAIGSVGLLSPATSTSNVGSYDLTGTAAVFAIGSASNYAITYATHTDGLIVTPRPIIVVADAQSRVFGDPNPSLTYQVGGRGLVNGDALSGGLATAATAQSRIGSYAITQGSLAASRNYTLSYVGADLTVRSSTDDNPINPVVVAGGQYQPPKTTSINFVTASNTPGSLTILTAPAPPTRTAAAPAPASQDITGSLGDGLAYPPISQYDAAQYSGGKLPDYADHAGFATILTMIARAAAHDAAPKIDQLFDPAKGADWHGVGWHNPLVDKVTFAGAQAGEPTAESAVALGGNTDLGALLGHGPVILAGAGETWLLATLRTEDGIVANDPLTGLRVLLGYDPATMTVGPISRIFDPGSSKWITFDAAAAAAAGIASIDAAKLATLKAFAAEKYLAVAVAN